MTKRILNSLTIGKIAAVDVPCQEGAQALILKRAANVATPGAENFEGQLAQENLWDNYGRAQSALQQSIQSIMGDDSVAGKGAMIQQSLDEFCEYIGQLVPSDSTNALAQGLQATLPAPAANAENPTPQALKKALGLPATATGAEMLDTIEALTKATKADERGGDVAKMLTAGDAFEAADGAIVFKSKVGNETFAILKAQNAEIAKQAGELAKRDETEATAKFEKRAADLGFEPSFGATLRKANGGDAATQTKVEKRIAGLNHQIEEGALFMSFGKSSPKEGSAESEFLAKVDAARKADPKLTHAQAYARIYKSRDNAALIQRMTAEQRGAN
jgi:hypothetical protein